MDYFGELSINRMYIFDRRGRNTNKVKPNVESWMEELGSKVKNGNFKPPVQINVYGHFKDNRHPDIHNLHKVIGDGVKKGLSIDDKDYLINDIGFDVNNELPFLEIEVLQGV